MANRAVDSEVSNAPDATREALCKLMDEARLRVTRASPLAAMFARHQDDIPATTLLRHAMEQAQSAGLFRPLHAKAFCMLEDAQSPVVRLWGQHGMSEDHREAAALAYLRHAGLGAAAIAEMPMLTSTLRLRRFVEWATGLHGPLPILLHALWMERNREFGSDLFRTRPEAAEGAHAEGILEVVANVAADAQAMKAAAQLIHAIAEFTAMYFAELDAVCGTAAPAGRERRPAADVSLPAR
ncbi:MAG: hypothetical protein JNK75_04335 [Betaproteobacteria bacterium]|nr:hypothetical protein [Betaproteobacteria bacterium]